MGLGKCLPVPLGYSVTPPCPPAAGVHKGPKSPEDPETKSLGGGLDASRVPPLGLFTCGSLCLIFLSPSLSPSRVFIARPNSSGKPSQITGSCCEPLILKLPPHALSTWLSCCFLVVSCFCLSLQLNCKRLKRKRKSHIFYSFCTSGLFYPQTGTSKGKAGLQEWEDLGHDRKLSIPSSPIFLCSLETR